MDPKELIAALGVFADPNASDEDKAAALDKLTSYFNSLLDDAEAEPAAEPAAEAASEAAAEDDKKKDEPAKEAASASAEPSKEMASALAQIKALTSRLAKVEKASAVGLAPRRAAPTVLPRVEPVVQKDHIVSMIEAAERNTLRNLSK
jgi:hypothetical protein